MTIQRGQVSLPDQLGLSGRLDTVTRHKSPMTRPGATASVPQMAGDQPIAGVRSPTRTGRSVRLQAIAVAALAGLPLTVSGHYLANVVTGHTAQGPQVVSFMWLAVFSFLGVTLVLAAVSNLLPGWERAGRRTVVALSAGVVATTIDYWQLVDAPSGLALNFAGLGVTVAALQAIYWTPRTPLTTISLRSSERIQEWFASMLVLGGTLAFALPHPATIDGSPEDCSPLWIIVERDCLSGDTVWWPFAVAAVALGLTMLSVIHHEPTHTRGSSPGRAINVRHGRGALRSYPYVSRPRRSRWF